jgi:hypothetical protein
MTFPIFAIALLRYGDRRVFAAVIGLLTLCSTALMAALFDPEAPTSRLYFGTDTRAAEILLGALLATWHAGRPALRGRARSIAIAVGAFGLAGNFFYWFAVSMETPWLWQGGFLLYAGLTAAIILGTLQPSGPARAVLSWGPLPWLGKISYGVYIYHFSFYVTLTSDLTGLEPWPLFILRVAATFAVAVPSYYFLEQPIRRGRMMPGRRLWVAMPVGIVLVVGMLFVATLEPPKQTVDLADMTHLQRVVESTDGPGIMVIGGSISYGVGKGLQRWAFRTREASVFNMARKGCGLSRGGRLVNKFKRASDLCDGWPELYREQLDKHDPDVVIVLVSGWDTTPRNFPEWDNETHGVGNALYDEWLISEYEVAVDVLTSRGARVIWLTTPCLEARLGGFGVWSPKRTESLNVVLRRFKEKLGDRIELVDFNAKVCPAGVFTKEFDGFENARPDGAHLSNEAADYIAAWLAEPIVARFEREK